MVVAGFDPLSLAPHGAKLRAISGEGQITGCTTVLETLGGYETDSTIFAEVLAPKPKPKSQPGKDIATTMRVPRSFCRREVRSRPAVSLVV